MTHLWRHTLIGLFVGMLFNPSGGFASNDKIMKPSASPARSSLKAFEELTPQEKSNQIKTWMDRGKSYLELGAYEEALKSTEQVFLLDADNLEASRLVDEIKTQIRARGAEDTLFLNGVYQEEIQERIQNYVQQADQWIREGKTGAARMAVDKVLLLDSENIEGQKLQAILDVTDEINAPRTTSQSSLGKDEKRETL